MTIRSQLEDLIKIVQEPVQVVKEINRHLYKLFNIQSDTLWLLTAIYLALDIRRKTIEFLNAGHPPGILLEEGTTRLLASTCPPLGRESETEVVSTTLSYRESFEIILFTDGLLEQINRLSLQKAITAVADYFAENKGRKPADLLEDMLCMDGKKGKQDDLTLLKVTCG